MEDHTFSKLANHQVTLIFLRGLCGYVWVNILTSTTPEGIMHVSKVAFIILSPSAIEASHSWLMRQSELYAIITQPIALMSVGRTSMPGLFAHFQQTVHLQWYRDFMNVHFSNLLSLERIRVHLGKLQVFRYNFHLTRHLSLLGKQRKHGMGSLPDTFIYN